MLVEGGEERIANRRKEKRGGVPERDQHTIFMDRVSRGGAWACYVDKE